MPPSPRPYPPKPAEVYFFGTCLVDLIYPEAGLAAVELSLVEVSRQDGVDELSLHLIASHHGWARPYFEPRAYDRRWMAESQRAVLGAAQRFGEIQAAWGTWGLAYLETIMKAADGLVSQAEEGTLDE